MKLRRYFTLMHKEGRVQFPTFDLAANGKTLDFDVSLGKKFRRVEVAFATDPPDAPVTFEVNVTSRVDGAGVFLGHGQRIPNDHPIALVRSDARVAGFPAHHQEMLTGCFIRAVRAPAESAPRAKLSPEALEHFKALGYAGGSDEEAGN